MSGCRDSAIPPGGLDTPFRILSNPWRSSDPFGHGPAAFCRRAHFQPISPGDVLPVAGPHLLPSSLHRVLYLDPDILVINPLTPFGRPELQGNLFAAASHTTVNDLVNGINRIRLKTDQDYYNTGVLLMDLDRGRTDIHPQEIFQHVQEHGSELLLPDQDVFNTLYGAKTLWIDDALWNYDARYYPGYLLRGNGAYHMDWVMQNTAILHFCGKRKPWKKSIRRPLCHALQAL